MQIFPPKAPQDRYYYNFEFGRDLNEETIASAEVTVFDCVNDMSDVTAELTNLGNQITSDISVGAWIRGGVAGNSYIVRCVAYSTGGEYFTLEGLLLVR